MAEVKLGQPPSHPNPQASTEPPQRTSSPWGHRAAGDQESRRLLSFSVSPPPHPRPSWCMPSAGARRSHGPQGTGGHTASPQPVLPTGAAPSLRRAG